ncbi:MAG: hypothetical protein M1820_002777 [Bogoriella megaspora]|nr:MAG: hypothetical protein M1820_002777 [Bogoriella megaspora]
MASLPLKVKAIYDYSSPHEDDLSFPAGQIITVTEEEDADWYVGEYEDASGSKKEGLFPKNFVEKYEPAVPSRPSRPARPKTEQAAPAPVPAPTEPVSEAAMSQGEREEPKTRAPPVEIPPATAQEPSPQSPPVATAKPGIEPQPQPPTASKPTPSAKAPPPAVAEKPSSFKDRIAAFNKPAAPPVAPKPQGPPTSSSFIKKPYVAPPPSKNAYVPPPREPPPQKIYRREEDPDVLERQAQDTEAAEVAGLAGPSVSSETAEEGASKPQSLKERIALLQKQQAEQAMRRAESSQKEKPKKPQKKPSEPRDAPDLEGVEQTSAAAPEELSRASTDLTREATRKSIDRPTPRGPRSPESTRDRDFFSDGNEADQSAAGETTEDAEGTSGVEDAEDQGPSKVPVGHSRPAAVPKEEAEAGGEDDTEEEGEEESEMDAEARRRLELRERMAKMSGGMGMAGMFGPPMPMPGAAPKKKSTTSTKDTKSITETESVSPTSPQSRSAPMIPVPGMQRTMSPKEEPEVVSLDVAKDEEEAHPITSERPPEEVPDIEEVKPEAPPRRSTDRAPPPPIPQDRPVPPLPSERPVPSRPAERAAPLPPPELSNPSVPHRIQSPSAGSESDDELSGYPSGHSTRASTMDGSGTTQRGPPPPVPGGNSAPGVPARPPQSPPGRRSSQLGIDSDSSSIPSRTQEQRSSRVPPIPVVPAATNRAPPPLPPSAPPANRPEDDDDDEEEEETEYEGDYDTDIASGAKHKDALKSHPRETSLDESTLTDEKPTRSPTSSTATAPPPIPNTSRAAPPPLPSQPPPASRPSLDAPRGAPPPVPSREPVMGATISGPPANEYDPYRYETPPASMSRKSTGLAAPPQAPPQLPPMDLSRPDDDDDDLYSSSPPRAPHDRPPLPPPQAPSARDRVPPPRPSHEASSFATSSEGHARSAPRQSLDVNRTLNSSRRSMDQPRPSNDGFMAGDIDLAESTQWWARPNTPPPAFHDRKDVLYEVEESSSSKRGRNTVSKDVYILFIDYSQTIITVRFDAQNPADATLEQRHEPPPSRLRQDQLEDAHSRFGSRIAEAINSKQNTVVGDGSPSGLVLELLRPLQSALMPVGTRAYGALVYANLANASVQPYDEIRPGDIITFRNAKFQGKHGAMHNKYSMEVGNPDHVAVVAEWDGTKKKVRAFEQGREGRKVKLESFKVGDLRSGEIKVWRVMGRNWVGWEG